MIPRPTQIFQVRSNIPIAVRIRRFLSGLVFEAVALVGSRRQLGPFRIVVLNPRGSKDLDELVTRFDEANDLLLKHDPVHAQELRSRISTLVITDTMVSRVVPTQAMAIVSRTAVERLNSVSLAAQLVYYATHLRLLETGDVTGDERRDVECTCLREELAFLERVDGTMDMQIRAHEHLREKGC